MKIVTQTASAGPNGHLDAGKTVLVPDPFGRHLCSIGSARPANQDERVNAEWPHSVQVPEPTKPDPAKGK